MRPRVVIAGGAGFLGSHLCERMLVDGYDVVCVDNLVTGRRENLTDLGPVQFVHQDVTTPLDVSGPVDLVLHLASPASPVDYLRLPVETLRAGSLGTFHTLELARAKGARYLLASTSEVYGDPLVHPQPESYWGHVNPVGPRSVYDEAKRFAEAAVTAYRHSYGVDTAIVRIFNTYGPRMRQDDGRAVPTYIAQAMRDEPLTIAGTGTQTRSMCYVTDLVEGIVRLLASGHPGPMNIGNPEERPMLDVARLVLEVSGSRSPVVFVPRATDDPEQRRPDVTLAADVLGWRAEVSLADGLRRTVAWFVEHHRLAASRA